MNFEQEIHNQNNARRMNILKSFSDFSEDLLQKSEDGSELEKGHMDFSNQRVYADNSVNRKLNRVGQKYGGRNVEDEKVVDKKDNSEEEGDENKPTPPQETQPNEQGQYSTEQLTEFASQAEDWQLQEFLDNAKKSGDNSEYMQAQVNIAETELNRRRVGTKSGEENGNSDSERNFEQQESDYQENMSNVDENGLPDFNDIEAVKNFLNENPQIKDRALAIVNDDIFIPMKDAIKLANAETKSSGEAMKTVEAAKQALDEVYNKLGGNSSMNELDMSKYSPEDIKGMSNADLQSLFEEYTGGDPEDYSRSEMEEELIGRIEAENPNVENPNVENKNGPANPSLHFSEMSDDELEDMYADDNFNSMEEQVAAGKEYDEAYGESDESGEKVSNEQHQLLAETFGDDGEDYEDANDFLSYARNNDDDGDFANLSDEEIKNWFETQKGAINGGEFENMPEYFGKKVTRVSPWGDDKIIIEHPDGSERTLKPGDKHYDELVKFKTDTNRFDDNTNSENQSSNDKERTNEANKNSNQYGVDKVSQKSLQNIYDSGEHYEDAEDFRESVRDYNNEDSGVSDLSDKEIETWFDLYNSDKRKY